VKFIYLRKSTDSTLNYISFYEKKNERKKIRRKEEEIQRRFRYAAHPIAYTLGCVFHH